MTILGKCVFCKNDITSRGQLNATDQLSRTWHVDCIMQHASQFTEPDKGEDIPAAEAYQECNKALLTECIDWFRSKQGDYEGTFLDLGSIGQFSDINRKVGKLRLAVIKNKKLAFESPEEITKDLFGHVLLMLFCLRKGI